MKKCSKKIRKATDDFVFDNEVIARQIFSDMINILVQKK